MKHLLPVLIATVSLGIASCDDDGRSPRPPIGKNCNVQFRRDALGAAASLPVSPLTSSINGATTSVSGKLKAVSKDWIILERGNEEIWIPKGVVLLIQATP
jgi:hypothetical protein